MSDDAFAIGLDTTVNTDIGRADDGDNGVAREVDRLGARLIWFPGAGAGGTHGYQFSLITLFAGTVTRCLLPGLGRPSGAYPQYWLHAHVRGDAANGWRSPCYRRRGTVGRPGRRHGDP
jgi:hypothetical protein